MLRITSTYRDANTVRLLVEGRIEGPWVAVLEREIGTALATCGRVMLDMTSLTYIDVEGVRMLQSFSRGGLTLNGCTAFVNALLTESPDDL